MKTFKTWLLIFLIITTLISIYILFFKPMYLITATSPDGKYKLEVYEEPKLFSAPGDGGTKCAKFKLYKGSKRIHDDCPDCPAFTNDMSIRWDMEDSLVFFTKGHAIDIETGKCLY